MLIGPDATSATSALNLPLLRASLRPGPEIADWIGRRAFAFAGIARPDKFFTMLAEAGVRVAGTLRFPDHHAFSEADLRRVLEQAARLDARPVTTPKDAVRLPAAWRGRVGIIGVSLAWEDPVAIDALLERFTLDATRRVRHGDAS